VLSADPIEVSVAMPDESVESPDDGGKRARGQLARRGVPADHVRVAERSGWGETAMWRFSVIVDRRPSPKQRRALPPFAVVLPEPGTATARVRFQWPRRSLTDAVAVSIVAVERVGLRAIRVDAYDWVTMQDIADRVHRSRETVRLWTLGRLGVSGFPPPLNPGQRNAFFSWAEVLAWLRRGRLAPEVPDEEPVLVAANLVLQLRALTPRLSDPSKIWRLAGTPRLAEAPLDGRPRRAR